MSDYTDALEFLNKLTEDSQDDYWVCAECGFKTNPEMSLICAHCGERKTVSNA